MRWHAEKAAQAFVQEHFPGCRTALLGGSVVRGEATSRSDLDIIIIDDSTADSYRESVVFLGWPIEAFVHNSTSYKSFFEKDCKRGCPSLPKLCSEGTVIKDDGFAVQLKSEAEALLNKGPEPWTREEIDIKRYFISDALEDFEGSNNRAEDIFIANTLAEGLHEFVLRTNGCWIGSSKWIVRALNRYDKDFCERFVTIFDRFYKTGETDGVIALADEVLEPCGGRLFDGFSIGRPI